MVSEGSQEGTPRGQTGWGQWHSRNMGNKKVGVKVFENFARNFSNCDSYVFKFRNQGLYDTSTGVELDTNSLLNKTDCNVLIVETDQQLKATHISAEIKWDKV